VTVDLGPDNDQDTIDASGGHASGDTLIGIENIVGSAYSDQLYGNAADNLIEAGAGNDRIVADLGVSNTLEGGPGDDIFIGGQSDRMFGGEGDDYFIGGVRKDSGFINDMADVIFGGPGADTMAGKLGPDVLRGDAGNDTILGGAGGDTIAGGARSDLLIGGSGPDFLNGGFGFDRMNGSTGRDRFFHRGEDGHATDWIQGYDASEGDVLLYGANAEPDDFDVTFPDSGSGDSDVNEAFVTHQPSGQTLWALVDGEGQDSINLSINGGMEVDLLG
jgi:Ca2+-binding RTX toxin-like protein